jgi:hypothetical protein
MYSLPIEDMAIATAEHFRKASGTSTNNARDAIAAWDEYVKYHRSYSGPGSFIESDEKCKYWFILGYSAATAPVA